MAEPGNAVDPQQLHHRLKIALAAYLVHLAVPLFLVFDVITAQRLGYLRFQTWQGDTIIAGVSLLWLMTGLGYLVLMGDRKLFLQKISGPLISIYAVYLCLIVAELVARAAIGPIPPIPTVWPPRNRWVSKIDSSEYPGVHGVKTFTVNEIGLRGPSLPHGENAYKIVAVGGSTTECLALDDSEEWPHLLMQEMNSGQKRYSVWVANAGVGAHNTVHHLVLMQTVPILRQADMLIFLIGINDLQASVAFEGSATQTVLEAKASKYREYLLDRAYPRYRYPLYKRLQLFQLAKKAALSLVRKFKPQSWTWWLNRLPTFRKQRVEGPIVPLPDIGTGLREYGGRVLALARECRAFRVRCLFLTQPTMWRSGLTPAEEHLIWSGNVGRWGKPKGYVPTADLARAMDAYNCLMLGICKQNGLECYDLESYVPKNTSAFFDHCHFNEAGSSLVAHMLADYLLSRPPFEENKAFAGEDAR